MEPEPPPLGLFAGAKPRQQTVIRLLFVNIVSCLIWNVNTFIPKCASLTCCSWTLGGFLLLNDFEFGLVLLLLTVPFLPVVQDAVQHGLDLWVEAGKLLRLKRRVSNSSQSRFVSSVKRQSSHLVDEGADEINETALQFGELCRLGPVHHGLVGGTRRCLSHL